ncbi:ABC transporter ATP-binding protein [Tengunoibacter tsumagoiensis]|uniref:ABC transporter ATP-binding protein n=1 Tax=Tengunoibacter tsumagoiensis TaxID=2014871 RepID=A0A402A478_9CHLR|nr:ABC transporter ATP-binding protein [Tengunoibacter tsumagoiensis]GCE13795.1 ABC transporter ATP-binding protein [Tengunoibacter tsumagoiensis]
MILELENVFAGYGGGDVLQGVDLKIEKGSITCIVGPNGAGKSTILRAVSGLLKPRQGTIIYNGKSLVGLTPRKILASGLAQVPQEHSLFVDMTIRENVRLGAYLINDKALVRKRLQEIEALFPLIAERSEEKAGSLSGGQQRMVEFARSLMLDPQLILLDEPSMGLDPKTRKQIFEMIKVMQELGKTIVLVEQNVRTGFGIAHHGVVMESGRVRLEGEPAALLDNPEISHLYLGGTLSKA